MTALDGAFLDSSAVRRIRMEARVPMADGIWMRVSRSVDLTSRSRDGIPASKIVVVHEGVNTSKISKLPAVDAHAAFFLPHGAPVVGNVALPGNATVVANRLVNGDFSDPTALNGNGLIAIYNIRDRRQQDVGNITNDIRASRVDVFAGALLTNLIAAFIVVACAATLYAANLKIDTAADAAAPPPAPPGRPGSPR